MSSYDKTGTLLTCTETKPDDILEINFNDFPDLLLPYAVACLCKGIHFHFTGVSHLRLKESDRISSLQTESAKLGFDVKAGDDWIKWTGETLTPVDSPVIDPHDDHRVAMAFAVAAIKFENIRIEHPEVVEKSFNDFWNQLEKLGLHPQIDSLNNI